MKRAALIYGVRTGIIFFWALFFIGSLYLLQLTFRQETERSITIFAWGDIFDPAYLRKFEEETGIKLKLSFFSSNEELLVKLRATKGQGYDLIVPSDYAIDHLRKEGLLKELDHAKLPFFSALNPLLLNLSYDPHNKYSVPFSWEIFGVGIDKEIIKKADAEKLGWELIFKPQDHSVVMVNDPKEAILFAAHYLFGPVAALNPEQLQQVEELLKKQKKSVEAYSSFRADYFIATKNSPVAVASSSYVWRSMEAYPNIGFIIPENGAFITIESLAIPAASHKEDLVYEFINFMFRPETIKYHFNLFAFSPARIDVIPELDLDEEDKAIIYSSPAAFKKYSFIRPLVDEQAKHDLWVSVKS